VLVDQDREPVAPSGRLPSWSSGGCAGDERSAIVVLGLRGRARGGDVKIATRLRLTIDGPELMCAYCGEWWPIDTESWRVNSLDPTKQKVQWSQCRACFREADRLRHAKRYAEDAEMRRRNAERCAAYKRRWRYYIAREHPELLEAHDNEVADRRRRRVRERRSYKLREDVA
jgi:hypothetical protein